MAGRWGPLHFVRVSASGNRRPWIHYTWRGEHHQGRARSGGLPSGLLPIYHDELFNIICRCKCTEWDYTTQPSPPADTRRTTRVNLTATS